MLPRRKAQRPSLDECRRTQRFELGSGLLVDFGQEMVVTVVSEGDARMVVSR
jgi:hypothetical protein